MRFRHLRLLPFLAFFLFQAVETYAQLGNITQQLNITNRPGNNQYLITQTMRTSQVQITGPSQEAWYDVIVTGINWYDEAAGDSFNGAGRWGYVIGSGYVRDLNGPGPMGQQAQQATVGPFIWGIPNDGSLHNLPGRGGYNVTITFYDAPPTDPSATILGTAGTREFYIDVENNLEILSIDFSAGTYQSGDVLTVTVTYRNGNFFGNADPAGSPVRQSRPVHPFRVVNTDFRLSTDANWGRYDDLITNAQYNQFFDDFELKRIAILGDGINGQAWRDSYLDPAETVTVTTDMIIPTNYAGTYFLGAQVDSTNSPFLEDLNPIDNTFVDTVTAHIQIIDNNPPTLLPVSEISDPNGIQQTPSNDHSDTPSVSGDGSIIAFRSIASNLVPNDNNGQYDIFVRRRDSGQIQLVSINFQGQQANRNSQDPAISSDGRYVAFSSQATNLVSRDDGGFADIFVHDLDTLSTVRISQRILFQSDVFYTIDADGASFAPSISENGRFLVFSSYARNLDPDFDGKFPPGSSRIKYVYLHDRCLDNNFKNIDKANNVRTYLVSVASDGQTIASDNSNTPKISRNAQWLVFSSFATNLSPFVTLNGALSPAPALNTFQQIYRRRIFDPGVDLEGSADDTLPNDPALTATLELLSINNSGDIGNSDSYQPVVNYDGTEIAFASDASNLDERMSDENNVPDVFVRSFGDGIGSTVRVSVSTGGNEAIDIEDGVSAAAGSLEPSIDDTGRFVAFRSNSDSLTQLAPLTNGSSDIFLHDRDADENGRFDEVESSGISTIVVSVNRFGLATRGQISGRIDALVPNTAYQSPDYFGVPTPWAPLQVSSSNRLPSISANGRFIAFESDADGVGGLRFGRTNMFPQDTNGARDIFMYDRNVVLGSSIPAIPEEDPDPAPIINVVNASTLSGGLTISVPKSTSTSQSQDPFTNVDPDTGLPYFTVGTPIYLTLDAESKLSLPVLPGGATSEIATVELLVNGVVVNTITSPEVPSTFRFVVSWTPVTPGEFSLVIRATDVLGNSTLSTESINVLVRRSASKVPVAEILNPETGDFYTSVSSLPLAASASDVDGNLIGLQFFVNNQPWGDPIYRYPTFQPGGFPFSKIWTPGSSDIFSIYTVVWDSSGNFAMSRPVTVTSTIGENPPERPKLKGLMELAEATAVINNAGQVVDVQLNQTSPGRGYAYRPTVRFENFGSGGSGAQASANIEYYPSLREWVITGFEVTDPGSGYSSPPTVHIENGFHGIVSSGRDAILAIPPLIHPTQLNSGLGLVAVGGTDPDGNPLTPPGISTVVVVNPGAGYVTPPTISFSHPSGQFANATATLDDNGGIASVTVNNQGGGPNGQPGYDFNTRVTTLGGKPQQGEAITYTTEDPGGFIQDVTFYRLGASSWSQLGSAQVSKPYRGLFTATTPGIAQVFAMVKDDDGNVTTSLPFIRNVVVPTEPKVSFTPSHRASASAIIDGGVISGFNIDFAGLNYNSEPEVVISGDGTGAVARATVDINGTVTGIQVISGGQNYTAASVELLGGLGSIDVVDEYVLGETISFDLHVEDDGEIVRLVLLRDGESPEDVRQGVGGVGLDETVAVGREAGTSTQDIYAPGKWYYEGSKPNFTVHYTPSDLGILDLQVAIFDDDGNMTTSPVYRTRVHNGEEPVIKWITPIPDSLMASDFASDYDQRQEVTLVVEATDPDWQARQARVLATSGAAREPAIVRELEYVSFWADDQLIGEANRILGTNFYAIQFKPTLSLDTHTYKIHSIAVDHQGIFPANPNTVIGNRGKTQPEYLKIRKTPSRVPVVNLVYPAPPVLIEPEGGGVAVLPHALEGLLSITDQSTIQLTAYARDQDGSLERVEFYENGQFLEHYSAYLKLGFEFEGPFDQEADYDLVEGHQFEIYNPDFQFARVSFEFDHDGNYTADFPVTIDPFDVSKTLDNLILAVNNAGIAAGFGMAGELSASRIGSRGLLLEHKDPNTQLSLRVLHGASFALDGFVRGMIRYPSFQEESQPYSMSWSPPGEGLFTIHSVAVDSSGNRVMSEVGYVSSTQTAPRFDLPAISLKSLATTVEVIDPLSGERTGFGFADVAGSTLNQNFTPALPSGQTTGVLPTSQGTSNFPVNTVVVTDGAWTAGGVSGGGVMRIQDWNNSVHSDTGFLPTSTVTLFPGSAQPGGASGGGAPTGGGQQGANPAEVVTTANTILLEIDKLVLHQHDIRNVTFFVNGQASPPDTSSLFQAIWTPSYPGLYEIFAQGKDDHGNLIQSPVQRIFVKNVGQAEDPESGFRPKVWITSPSHGEVFNLKQDVTPVAPGTQPGQVNVPLETLNVEVRAEPGDEAGTAIVAQVQLYASGVSVGIDTTFPYQFLYQPTSLGKVQLVAEAIDIYGNVAYSTSHTVTVSDGIERYDFDPTGEGPIIRITSPVNGQEYLLTGGGAADAIIITADALPHPDRPSDMIAQVEFYVNDVFIAADVDYPYSTDLFIPTSRGEYIIRAVARDTRMKKSEAVLSTGLSGNVTRNSASSPNVISISVIENQFLNPAPPTWPLPEDEPTGDNPIYDKEFDEGFIIQVHRDLYLRNPSTSELTNYTNSLQSGLKTRAQFIHELFQFEENVRNVETTLAQYMITGSWATRNDVVFNAYLYGVDAVDPATGDPMPPSTANGTPVERINFTAVPVPQTNNNNNNNNNNFGGGNNNNGGFGRQQQFQVTEYQYTNANIQFPDVREAVIGGIDRGAEDPAFLPGNANPTPNNGNNNNQAQQQGPILVQGWTGLRAVGMYHFFSNRTYSRHAYDVDENDEVGYQLFLRKYGVNPSEPQLYQVERFMDFNYESRQGYYEDPDGMDPSSLKAIRYNNEALADAVRIEFILDFAVDNDVETFAGIRVTDILELVDPPNSTLIDNAYAHTLWVGLARQEPDEAKFLELRQQGDLLAQIQYVLDSNEYRSRFTSSSVSTSSTKSNWATGAKYLAEDWFGHEGFGYFSTPQITKGWVMHFGKNAGSPGLGWVYIPFEQKPDSFWFWREDYGWCWTSVSQEGELFPHFYSHDKACWHYFNDTRPGDPWVYDYGSESWSQLK